MIKYICQSIGVCDKLKQQVRAVAAIPIVHENATWIQTAKANTLRSVKKFSRYNKIRK
jgi:hypothetical protein